MSADTLLSRLDRVREVGHGRWLALCPAHDDKSPSLSIREGDGGALLVHCFAGCSAADIVAAVGLKLSDLFPRRLGDYLSATRDRRHHHAAREALRVMRSEALIVAVGAEVVARGEVLNETDRQRLLEAAFRIREAAEVVIGESKR